MPQPPKAKWTTNPKEVSVTTGTDGTFHADIPLYDSAVKAGTFTFTITADRALAVLWTNEPGAAGLTGFVAWSKQG